jgi:enolase
MKSLLLQLLVWMQPTKSLLIELDGTESKSNLGANSILAISMAVAWAPAKANHLPLYRYLGGVNAKVLPTPMIQIIGGGAHAVNKTDIQDFLVIPVGSKSFSEGYEMVVNVYNATKEIFLKHEKPLSTADEGGFWPTNFKTLRISLTYMASLSSTRTI